MSYCVNCGVELEASLKKCPLCNVPVINPAQLDKNSISPFPGEKGQVEKVKRKDMAILLTVMLASISCICGVLNLFVFQSSAWSVFAIGACIILWVWFVPILIYARLTMYQAVVLDGLAVGFYLYLITYVTMGREWFWGLALPITVLVVGVIEVFVLCIKKLPVTFLTGILYFFTMVGILCLGIEILIDWYSYQEIKLVWSIVVGTICLFFDVVCITLLSRKNLRGAVRRRLHF